MLISAIIMYISDDSADPTLPATGFLAFGRVFGAKKSNITHLV